MYDSNYIFTDIAMPEIQFDKYTIAQMV